MCECECEGLRKEGWEVEGSEWKGILLSQPPFVNATECQCIGGFNCFYLK